VGFTNLPLFSAEYILVGSKRLPCQLANQRCTGECRMEFLHHLNRHARLGPSVYRHGQQRVRKEWMLEKHQSFNCTGTKKKNPRRRHPQTTGRHRYRFREQSQRKHPRCPCPCPWNRWTSGPNDSFPCRSRRRSTEQLSFPCDMPVDLWIFCGERRDSLFHYPTLAESVPAVRCRLRARDSRRFGFVANER
jgi:hypothetical protein